MKVSVAMITYNHESYIREALDGILMQETNFDFNIIIGEDTSSDNTKSIIQEYIEKFSNKISCTFHVNNLGMMPNFINTLKSCNGEYIAICEGDDYWIDPLKLQKQVDFLESNKDYVICFHKVMILNDNNLEADINIERRYNSIKKLPATVLDLLEHGNFIHTPSVLFRNQITDLPTEFVYSTVGDYFLYIIHSQKGYIKRLDEVMAIYRNNVGIYSTLSVTEMTKKMVIYNSCILSYLTSPDQREILLKRQISIINSMDISQSNTDLGIKNLINRLSIKDILNLFVQKIKRKF